MSTIAIFEQDLTKTPRINIYKLEFNSRNNLYKNNHIQISYFVTTITKPPLKPFSCPTLDHNQVIINHTIDNLLSWCSIIL